MAELNLMHKIAVLVFLDQTDGFISNNMITNYFLDHYITDYFSIQEAINSLVENELVNTEHTHGNTTYQINDRGRETLGLLGEKLSDELREDIAAHFRQNLPDLKRAASLIADYEKHTRGGWLCRLRLLEDKQEQIRIDLRVHSEAQAQAMCTNWRQRHEEVYDALMDILI